MSPDNPKPYSVSEINRCIKSIVAERKDLKNIWVRGEISNYVNSASGHVYFSLKDATSIIACTFFAFNYKNYKGKKLRDGTEVQAFGSITVYEQGGKYNLNVSKIDEIGVGDILFQIEQLKQKLSENGIFDPARKKPLPRFPLTLGIATSPTGAAIEDIIRIATERYPNINILIAPCQVQGADAPVSIARAIGELNKPEWEVDVIIAGRGGGSFEDLLAFNDEALVMAYYNSKVPIISAVGHQVDNVLTDYAADMAAPTPTAAAELAIPVIEDLEIYLDDMNARFTQALQYKLNIARDRYGLISSKQVLTEPELLLIDRIQKTDELLNRIFLLGKNYLGVKNLALQKYENLPFLAKSSLRNKVNVFSVLSERLENFSPLSTLKRGYSVLRNKDKKVITSGDQVEKGEELEAILAEGTIKVEVK